MKTTLYLFLIGLLCWSCQTQQDIFENAICIQNVSTIDAQSGLQENRTLVIQDNKILKNVPSSDLNLHPDNEIVDGSGKFVIPGLWDAHVHFAFLEELAPAMFDIFLSYGITSLRDTGGEIGFVKKWKDESVANPTTKPRLMIAGPLMDGMPNVYDGSDPQHPPLSVGLGSVEDAVKMVDYLDSMGVDLLKAYEMLSPEQFTAVAARAREKGLKVTGHVPLSMDVASASNAGLNSMEHLRNVEMSMAEDSDELLKIRRALLKAGQSDKGGVLRSRLHDAQRMTAIANIDPVNKQKVIEVLAKNSTWQIPTLVLPKTFTLKYYALEEWQESFQLLPKAIEEMWLEQTAIAGASEATQDAINYQAWMSDITREMHAGGVVFMAGTDTPIAFQTPGLSLHKELELFVDAGMSPLEALGSATWRPAQYFGLEGTLGLLKEGMIADILLLDANPLEEISNTKKIHAVVKDGNYMGPDALKALQEKLIAQ